MGGSSRDYSVAVAKQLISRITHSCASLRASAHGVNRQGSCSPGAVLLRTNGPGWYFERASVQRAKNHGISRQKRTVTSRVRAGRNRGSCSAAAALRAGARPACENGTWFLRAAPTTIDPARQAPHHRPSHERRLAAAIRRQVRKARRAALKAAISTPRTFGPTSRSCNGSSLGTGSTGGRRRHRAFRERSEWARTGRRDRRRGRRHPCPRARGHEDRPTSLRRTAVTAPDRNRTPRARLLVRSTIGQQEGLGPRATESTAVSSARDDPARIVLLHPDTRIVRPRPGSGQ